MSLIVRHNLICDKDRAKFETTTFGAAKALSDGENEHTVLTMLRGLSPTDDEVHQSFLGLSFGRGQHAPAQFILRAMEYNLRKTEELIIATPEKVHLEHIYPQKPAAANRLADHDEYIGRLGNLTLLDHALNQEAQNSSFPVKKTRFYSQSEIYLTRELLEKDSWTASEIEDRQDHLCQTAIELWPQNLINE